MSRPWAGAAVIAVDPGRDKCGLAAVAADGRLLHRAVVPTPELAQRLAAMVPDAPEATLLIGDGTSSREAQAALREALPATPLAVVPEAHSTERALERWRDTVAPPGWRRLLPRALRFPAEPIDDFAAWILAEDHRRGGDT
ncbi:MAG: hypothetical protein FJX74_24635 [Armatimonadetes bacterium]|nr:hypothetical protein [Armatimonadota bacterium]